MSFLAILLITLTVYLVMGLPSKAPQES